MGAALDWLRKEFGASILEVEDTQATGANPTEVTKNDPDALALVFVNFGAFDVTLSLKQNPPAGSGLVLKSNGGVVGLTVRDDLTLPTRSWFAASAGGASSLYILRLRSEVPNEAS